VAEETKQFVDQLAFGNAAGNAGWRRLGHRLQFGQRLEAELVDIDGRGGLGGFGILGQGHGECLGETPDLGSDDGLGTFVPENHVRTGHFFLNWKLGGEDGFDQGILEATPRFEPLDLGGAGRSDNQHVALAEIETLFKEQRNIRDEQVRAPFSSIFERIKTFLSDPGMHDGLQAEPRRFVGKHPAAKKVAVDAALGIQRLIPEGF
jgi:hypothetical protein